MKRDKAKDVAKIMGNEDKALVASARRNTAPMESALKASYKAFIGSGANAHMVKDIRVLTGKAITSEISIETVGKDTIKAAAQGESLAKLYDGEKPVTLNDLLHVQDGEYGLVTVSN